MRVGRKRPMFRWLLVVCLALGVAALGCDSKKKGGAVKAPPKKAAKPNKVDQALVDSASDSALADTYIYSPVGKRDPFRSSYKETSGSPKELDGPRGPLQQFEIDQLKLIAVISGISQPRAMVLAPDGKGYTVKVGTRIGKNYGRVVRIKVDQVIIAEDYRDWNGRKVTNYIHMTLKKEEIKR